jgi:hypothetical protein
MSIPFVNTNKYIISFIDDYIRMCWVYLQKDKSKAFETFKKFHVWIQNELRLVLALFTLIMEDNIHLMNFKVTFANMGSNIKQYFRTILNKMV